MSDLGLSSQNLKIFLESQGGQGTIQIDSLKDRSKFVRTDWKWKQMEKSKFKNKEQ